MPATVVLVLGEVEVARWPLAGRDLSVVDELMRLQLAARRLGGAVRVRDADEWLLDLLDLAGLRGVLRVEAVGEAERGEQRRVDEVVVPDDPVA